MACLQSPEFKAELARAARTQIKPETLLRIVLTQVRKVPKLQECSPQSFMAAVLTATQLGLEFGREAHLVPFKGEVQLIPDYKGLIQLAYRSGMVDSIITENVYANEHHSYRPANENPIDHRPLPPRERGDYVGSYAIAWMRGSARPVTAWLWGEDVRGIMNRSAAVKSGGSTPWQTDFSEMAKKTAVKRLSKMLPASAEFAAAVALDNQAEAGEGQDFVDVTPIAVADATPTTRTGRVAADAAAKTRAATGKAAPEIESPPLPGPVYGAETARADEAPAAEDTGDAGDTVAGEVMGLAASNLFLKLPAGSKAKLKEAYKFASSDEFRTWKSRDLQNLVEEMKALIDAK